MKEKRKKSFGKKGIPFFQVKDGQPVRYKALVKGKVKNVYGIKNGNGIVCGYKMLNGVKMGTGYLISDYQTVDIVRKPKLKRFHFQGRWKNGDRMVISSEGFNKKHAFANMLRLLGLKRYSMKKGDSFRMSYKTNEETHKIHGHTTYIVHGNTVEVN